MIQINHVCIHTKVKCIKPYKNFKLGKKYLCTGFGNYITDKGKRNVLCFKQYETEEAKEFIVFTETINNLVENKILQRL